MGLDEDVAEAVCHFGCLRQLESDQTGTVQRHYERLDREEFEWLQETSF